MIGDFHNITGDFVSITGDIGNLLANTHNITGDLDKIIANTHNTTGNFYKVTGHVDSVSYHLNGANRAIKKNEGHTSVNMIFFTKIISP